MFRTTNAIILLLSAILIFSACGSQNNGTPPSAQDPDGIHEEEHTPDNTKTPEPPNDPTPSPSNSVENEDEGMDDGEQQPDESEDAIPVVVDPHSIEVLVNKQYGLPEDYEPNDLVYPDVHFIFEEKIEKRMLRKEAAQALEEMFAGAKNDGIHLGGVSGYRSHATQTALFNRYVAKDGEEKAKTYSAVPGHSEHETGLAIDVSGSDGKCAAQDCFGGTKEAQWLEDHAWEYGFIIRYPKGKEEITGYQYEPWHLRYVGTEIAKDIKERGITLEEYYNAVPVSQS